MLGYTQINILGLRDWPIIASKCLTVTDNHVNLEIILTVLFCNDSGVLIDWNLEYVKSIFKSTVTWICYLKCER